METISRQELKAKLDANQGIKLVMTVGGWTFRAKHIPGSLSFPSPGRALQTLRRDDEIIVYSTSNGRQDTQAAFDAFIAAYDSAAKYENTWRREMREGKGAVAALTSAGRLFPGERRPYSLRAEDALEDAALEHLPGLDQQHLLLVVVQEVRPQLVGEQPAALRSSHPQSMPR